MDGNILLEVIRYKSSKQIRDFGLLKEKTRLVL